MARRRRIFVAGCPVHVVQRGNNRQAIFHDDEDCIRYLDCLVEVAGLHACATHCYVLMRNHVHFLMTPTHADSLPGTMQSLNGRYIKYFNKRYERTGGLWDGRYRPSLVDSNSYLQACYRYIELNPVRAGLCARPADYRWSSHRHNAFGEPSQLITPHPGYTALESADGARRRHYRGWFTNAMDEIELEVIRNTTRQCLPLGDDTFKASLAASLGKPVTPNPRGRPKKGVRHHFFD